MAVVLTVSGLCVLCLLVEFECAFVFVLGGCSAIDKKLIFKISS